jgi:hypothetical protein
VVEGNLGSGSARPSESGTELARSSACPSLARALQERLVQPPCFIVREFEHLAITQFEPHYVVRRHARTRGGLVVRGGFDLQQPDEPRFSSRNGTTSSGRREWAFAGDDLLVDRSLTAQDLAGLFTVSRRVAEPAWLRPWCASQPRSRAKRPSPPLQAFGHGLGTARDDTELPQ